MRGQRVRADFNQRACLGELGRPGVASDWVALPLLGESGIRRGADVNDSIRRDDLKASDTAEFDALPSDMRAALRRAAASGSADLPREMGEGWLMVPKKGRGPVQVAYQGTRAFRL